MLLDVTAGGIIGLAQGLGEHRTLACVASVADCVELNLAIRQALQWFGRLDMVFSNAGVACDPPATVRCMAESTVAPIIEVALLGVWRTVRSCLPGRHRREPGACVGFGVDLRLHQRHGQGRCRDVRPRLAR